MTRSRRSIRPGAGYIPLELAGLEGLSVLDVRENALSGRVPSDLGALKQVRDLLLSDNALEGPLPGYLGYMTGLRYLHIGTNEFTGAVPGSFARLELDTLYTSGSNICLPPSLGEWHSAIEKTDWGRTRVGMTWKRSRTVPGPTA